MPNNDDDDECVAEQSWVGRLCSSRRLAPARQQHARQHVSLMAHRGHTYVLCGMLFLQHSEHLTLAPWTGFYTNLSQLITELFNLNTKFSTNTWTNKISYFLSNMVFVQSFCN